METVIERKIMQDIMQEAGLLHPPLFQTFIPILYVMPGSSNWGVSYSYSRSGRELMCVASYSNSRAASYCNGFRISLNKHKGYSTCTNTKG